MPDGEFTLRDRRAALERLALTRIRVRTPGEATEAQVEFLVARIKLLTAVLRDAEENETTRLDARILLGDLAQIAAQFRGTATAVGTRLETALNDLDALSRAEREPL